MKNNNLVNEDNLNENRNININSGNLSNIVITFYILLLSIIEFFITHRTPYILLSIFFIGQFTKSLYKYIKNKDKIYFLELIACIIAFIGLITLEITN